MTKNLTEREKEFLKYFCYSDREIADILTLSLSTVKKHKHNIIKKFKARNALEVVVKCIKSGYMNAWNFDNSYINISNDTRKVKMIRTIDGKKGW